MLSDAELTAEAGLCVVIPCHFTTDPVIPLELTVWHKCDPSKQNCSDSDMVLHLNDTSPNAHTGSRVRVSLLEPDLSQKNCSIIINDLSESVSGSYHFRLNGILNGTEGEYASSGANVTVKGLTQKPTVMIPPLTEGQQTTLTCIAPGLCSGSVPEITWTWRGAGEMDSHITGNKTDVKTENLTAVTQRHSLTLTFNASAKHHDTNVTCKVSFANSISTEETVTLNISLKGNTATEKMTPNVTDVKKLEITGKTSVNEGDVLNLTCSFENFSPSLVMWSKDPSKTNLNSVDDTNLQNSTGSATLVIPNVTAEHTGQYICTATHLNKTLTTYANVTVILSPKILKSSGCIHQSEVLTCVCISEGFPLPTIKWPLLENHTEYSVLITVSNHTVNSTATLTVKDHSTSVECVSSNTNGEAKENLIISNAEQKQKEEGEVIKVLRIITRWEIIIAFSVGAFLSAIICCLARKCHRKKQRIYGNLAETLEMVPSHEVDAGQAVDDYQAIDQVADEARGAVAAGKSEVEYSKIDFSLINMKDPEEAGETQGTAETEYAEIKELKKIKEESEEDQGEEGEEEMTGEDEEKKHSEPEEKEGEGEDMADVLKSLNLLETLKESIELNKLSDVKDAVEDLLISRINLAVIGDRGDEKATFINSLRGLGPGDDGAAPSQSTVAPEEVAGYPNPKHPDFRLWDLPPVPSTSPFEPEGYMDKFKFLRYNAVVMTFTQTPQPNSVEVFLEARSLQRQIVYFILLASAKDTEKSLEEKRKASVDVLTSQGVTLPKVYLVRPSTLERFDFPGLLEDMGRDLPEIRAHALLFALPTLTSALVTQKKEAFKALVWAAASLSGGVSAIPVPLVASMVDSSVAVRILTKAQLSLCLDDESVERLARQRGLDPTRLKGLRTCVLSVEVSKGEVKKRLVAAEKDLATVSSKLVEMAMPRHARSASRSFAAMLQALNGAIDEMAADAEKIVAVALVEGK
ncbi:hypothetical protein ABVT39_026271 [Epinephelus coioides]